MTSSEVDWKSILGPGGELSGLGAYEKKLDQLIIKACMYLEDCHENDTEPEDLQERFGFTEHRANKVLKDWTSNLIMRDLDIGEWFGEEEE